MPIIDQSKLPIEITSKYSIVSNSFRMAKVKNAELDKYTNTPKDLITAEVGDVKQPDFLPQLKLARWGNNEEVGEVNFSIRLVDDEFGAETVNTLSDKIVWEKGNKKIEFYDFTEGEGGYKLVWFLKKKPKTNKVEFTIQSKGLDFFYQPELTPEEIAEGAFRPENVVGSYAVYHSTKGGMNDINGKEYKTGKAFHIYRPHIIDANGAETWGILHIENGIYSVEISQEFLDTAVYPIKSNDTFGYSGQASINNLADRIEGSYATGASGTITSITVGYHTTDTHGNNQPRTYFQIYLKSDGSQVATTGKFTVNAGQTDVEITQNLSTNPTISAVDYWLTAYCDYVGGYWPIIHYDTTGVDLGAYLSDTGEPPVTTFSGYTTEDKTYYIYATYTPSGGGTSFSPSISPSLSPSLSPSISPSASPSVSPSASISPSISPSVSPSVSSSVSPSQSLSPSISPSISYSVSPSASISPSISQSVSPSVSPSASISPSVSPSISPSVSPSASLSPSISPSISPSVSPSDSISPSISPSLSPSISPSQSISPSLSPSESPSISPSISSSFSPSTSPSASESPSISPSLSESISPSESPSLSPSTSPSQSISPSASPSVSPSISPSISPSTAYVAVLKRWTGSAWVRAKLLTYGTSFTAKPLKVRIGSDWGLVDVSG